MKYIKFLTLRKNEVHIWSAFLEGNKNNLFYFYSLLSEDEKERSNTFKFSKDKNYFIITRGILRCLLSLYLEQTPEKIEFVYGLWGKPYLLQENFLNFNVSHSGEYALYALTSGYEVGVDLEYIDISLKLEEIAPHIFSIAELNHWKNMDFKEQVNTFFSRWVSKESFLKALGKGWCEGEEKITFEMQNNLNKQNLNEKIAKETTNFFCFEYIPGYASALFVEGARLRPLYYSWNQNILKHIRVL
jgi:4'-phosphopantetheinyl transferase